MSEDLFDGGWADDAEMVTIVTQLAPIVTRQEWAQSQSPDQQFADKLRRRVAGRARRQRRRIPGLRLFGLLVGVAAVVAAVVLFYVQYGRATTKSGSSHTAALVLPVPSGAQLTKSYPPAGGVGGGGPPNPYASRIKLLQGASYPGRLTLSRGGLPSFSHTGSAYVLSRPPSPLGPYVASLARTLKIRGQVTHATVPVTGFGAARQTFYSVTHGVPTGIFRSVAISAFDGHFIYHDTTPETAGQKKATITPAAATSAARSWLGSLGLPGSRMPVIAVSPMGAPTGAVAGNSRQVQVNWPGIYHTDRVAAILWVDATRRVTEALLYPTIDHQGSVQLRDVGTVWKLVKSARTPIGVGINSAHRTIPGSGRLRSVSIEYVLGTGLHGKVYLYPTYRFSGTVTLRGIRGQHSWVALAPAVR
jgi:hypothetical protein